MANTIIPTVSTRGLVRRRLSITQDYFHAFNMVAMLILDTMATPTVHHHHQGNRVSK